MNNFSPDQLYDSIQARHQDIRNSEAARQAAILAQGEQPNRCRTLINNVINLTKITSPQPKTQTTTQATLRNKQA